MTTKQTYIASAIIILVAALFMFDVPAILSRSEYDQLKRDADYGRQARADAAAAEAPRPGAITAKDMLKRYPPLSPAEREQQNADCAYGRHAREQAEAASTRGRPPLSSFEKHAGIGFVPAKPCQSTTPNKHADIGFVPDCNQEKKTSR